MLTHPTGDKLQSLKLTGMVQALIEQMHLPDIDPLSCEERLGLLVDRERTARDQRRLQTRVQRAQRRVSASIEDLDSRHPRGGDTSVMARLVTCQWVHERHNVFITGPTGIGKTWLACALGHKACRNGLSALYLRLPRFLQELTIAKRDGRSMRVMTALAKTDGLVLDDWGMSKLNDANRRDLLEMGEDRYDSRSTIVTSQFPVEHWHDSIGDPTGADAMLDRLVHNA